MGHARHLRRFSKYAHARKALHSNSERRVSTEMRSLSNDCGPHAVCIDDKCNSAEYSICCCVHLFLICVAILCCWLLPSFAKSPLFVAWIHFPNIANVAICVLVARPSRCTDVGSSRNTLLIVWEHVKSSRALHLTGLVPTFTRAIKDPVVKCE